MSGAGRRASVRAGAQWKKFLEWQGKRPRPRAPQRRIPRNMSVEIPESKEYYDTASLKVGVGMVIVAVLAKLTMWYDESKEEERIERRAREFADSQTEAGGIVSRELWEELQQFRPRTPFESRTARDNARIRTGEDLRLEDVKDWAVDVITEALARKEDSMSRS